jgi:hypothetical protein
VVKDQFLKDQVNEGKICKLTITPNTTANAKTKECISYKKVKQMQTSTVCFGRNYISYISITNQQDIQLTLAITDIQQNFIASRTIICFKRTTYFHHQKGRFLFTGKTIGACCLL